MGRLATVLRCKPPIMMASGQGCASRYSGYPTCICGDCLSGQQSVISGIRDTIVVAMMHEQTCHETRVGPSSELSFKILGKCVCFHAFMPRMKTIWAQVPLVYIHVRCAMQLRLLILLKAALEAMDADISSIHGDSCRCLVQLSFSIIHRQDISRHAYALYFPRSTVVRCRRESISSR